MVFTSFYTTPNSCVMRSSTVASLKMLEGLEYIDMELKKVRNTISQSMKDQEYLKDMHS